MVDFSDWLWFVFFADLIDFVDFFDCFEPMLFWVTLAFIGWFCLFGLYLTGLRWFYFDFSFMLLTALRVLRVVCCSVFVVCWVCDFSTNLIVLFSRVFVTDLIFGCLLGWMCCLDLICWFDLRVCLVELLVLLICMFNVCCFGGSPLFVCSFGYSFVMFVPINLNFEGLFV